MTTLYTPEDPSLLTSPALPLFQACINQVAQQALQSGMPEITVNAVFKHHQTCFDIALDALTQAFGPLHTRTDPSMTIRTNESAQTVFRREFHRAFHDIINEHRPDAEAEVQDGVQSDAETERFDENTPLPDGDGTSNIVSKEHGPEAEAQEDVPSDAETERLDENSSLPDDGTSNVEQDSTLSATEPKRAGHRALNEFDRLDWDSDVAHDGRSDGSATSAPGTFPFPTPFGTAAGAQHDGPPGRRPQESDEKAFEWLPPPGAMRPSEVNAMQSHHSSHHLTERPSTPDRPIVPQDFKEGSRSEPTNRVSREEATEDWETDHPERPKPSRTADQAILPQKHNESDHVELVDRRAQKTKREKDAEDRKAETVSGDSRTADTAGLPQEINERGHIEFVDQRAEKAKREEEMSDLSGWMMTSN
jgi:hypothetical protein